MKPCMKLWNLAWNYETLHENIKACIEHELCMILKPHILKL